MSEETETEDIEDAKEVSDLPKWAQDHIHELRDEAATRRTSAKPYDDAFKHYTTDEKEYMLRLNSLAVGSAEEQAQAAKEYLRLSNALGAEETMPAPVSKPEDKKDDDDKSPESGMTEEQVEQRIGDRLAKADRDRDMKDRIAEVKRQAIALDYEVDSTEYDYLLTVARKETEGNLEKAHKIIGERRQKTIDDFVTDQQTAGKRFPTQSRSSASPPGDNKPPDWLGDDKKTDAAVRDWLDAHAGDT